MMMHDARCTDDHNSDDTVFFMVFVVDMDRGHGQDGDVPTLLLG